MKKQILKRIFSYVRPNAGLLAFAVLFAAAGVSLALYIPILIGKGIDCIVGVADVDFNRLTIMLLQIGGAVIFSAAFQWLMNLCANKITYKTVVSIRTQAFERLQQLPLGYMDSHSHGDILSRITT
ncbi:MAG: ABC transporter transmembrane domain-containing protein, partial [Oscillospiraceae bacterium]